MNIVVRLTDCARNDLTKCRRAVKYQHNNNATLKSLAATPEKVWEL